MDAMAISLCGLKACAAHFERSAANVARDSVPVANDVAASPGGNPPPPLSMSGLDFGADLVGMTMALASYRANIAAIGAENRMVKITVDLIG